MTRFQCYPAADPNAYWSYCPSYAAAIAFSVLFCMTTVGHIVQAFAYRKPFAVVLVIGAGWEAVGYTLRILSVQDQLNGGYFTGQQLLILLAPLWINAFAYMTIGRLIHFSLDPDRIFGMKARRITMMFVLFDISSFIVQGIGGEMTDPSDSISTQHLGLHIYMGGVGLQLLFNMLFITLTVRLQYVFHRHPELMRASADPRRAQRYIITPIYVVLGLIIFRNIYRLVEFSAGVLSSITQHEWYIWVFDSLPMLAAFIILHVYHPGRVLQGPHCDFSEENKALKAAKKAKKDEKKQKKLQDKEDKRQGQRQKGIVKQEQKRQKILDRLERKGKIPLQQLRSDSPEGLISYQASSAK